MLHIPLLRSTSLVDVDPSPAERQALNFLQAGQPGGVERLTLTTGMATWRAQALIECGPKPTAAVRPELRAMAEPGAGNERRCWRKGGSTSLLSFSDPQRRAAKLITGQRTRIAVTSRVPRPAATAARMSSSLLSSTGVTLGFQWKICRFQAPPAYPTSVGMKLRTLPLVGSLGSAACRRASCTAGVLPLASTMWKTMLPLLISCAACGDEVTSAVAWYWMIWW